MAGPVSILAIDAPSSLPWLFGLFALAFAAGASAEPAARFPFVIPGDDATRSATDMSALLPKPAGAEGFVRLQDGKLFVGGRRLRIWGMNVCFGANFPTHEEAEKVAAHLAKLGVNGVRFHHHDSANAPRGIWGGIVEGRRQFSAEQLDRQDYFLAQLHEHGIYANLNLHVSRTLTEEEGFLSEDLPRGLRYDKYLLYYVPRMRETLKAFCREYLCHENPYRGLRRVDDPGIAMLEITNENRFSKEGPALAASLPEPYRGEFKRQWNGWLKPRYGTTEAARRAWNEQRVPLGEPLADMGDFGARLAPWRLHVAEGAVTPRVGAPGPKPGIPALQLDMATPAQSAWRQELMRLDMSVTQDRLYTLAFWAKADAPRRLHVDVSNQGPGDWKAAGFEETIELGPEWTQLTRVFRARRTLDQNARICFKFGGSPVGFSLADVSLRPGGHLITVPDGQSIEQGNVEIPVKGWADEAQAAAHEFMVDREEEFTRDILRFLKDELGAKVPITCSQLGWQATEAVAATCDYADIHGYWQHPHFPGRPWDGNNWLIKNTPMEAVPGNDTMTSRAVQRLLDRPFTVSEWNIPNPHDYAASVAPFAAVMAALQDWDGVFFFQYHSSHQDWFTDRLHGYFSFNGQPVKLALLAACANVYLRGDLPPLSRTAAGTIDAPLPGALALAYRTGIDPAAREAPPPDLPPGKRLASPDGAVVWDASDAGRAHVALNTPASRGVWGLIAGRRFTLGGLELSLGPVERDYAAVILTSLDGKPLEQSGRMLLVAAGSAENIGMGWNEERTSVGRNWGKGPTQVNGIPAVVTLPGALRTVQALDGRGAPAARVPADVQADGCTRFRIGPEHKTLWYELCR
ncbi:MAG: hypothetical protein JXR37_34570 [Kiritimatiellae bacterium]|nr:hypothetical protein [Kiritimatiellia bacterium]